MIYVIVSLILLVYFISLKFLIKSIPERIFLHVFTVSSLYYGVFSIWYWKNFHDGIFLGADWENMFPDVMLTFALVYVIVTLSVSILARNKNFFESNYPTYLTKNHTRSIEFLLLVIGFFSLVYAYVKGGQLLKTGDLTDDPLLLIFFQFGDIPVGVLLFWAATRGIDKRWILFASAYILIGVLLGLRSKLLLLMVPVLLAFYMQTRPLRSQLFTRGGIIIGMLGVVSLFSIMTITREKFSGLDFSAIENAGFDELLYSFFAETNIIFGLASTLSIYGNKIEFAGWSPFSDVIVQFIPRFLYPDKDLYLHLKDIAWWISESEISLGSGTSIPFFGEYYAAFGWFGVILGAIFYSALTVGMFNFIRRFSVTYKQYLIGAALIAVFMGYYYFSRGSMSQLFKVFIFACGPYFFLLMINFRRLNTSS